MVYVDIFLLLLIASAPAGGGAVAGSAAVHATAAEVASDRFVWTTRPDPPVIRAAHTEAPSATPGGPYGLVQTPYMGWRSWNAYHNNVNQTLLEAVMEAMVAKQQDGRSLSDLGFTSVGLDDAWQGFDSGRPGIDACQQGYNGTFHDEHGNPLWAKATFPDPAGMVAKAHSLGLKAGWYMNNCREWAHTFTLLP
jgi:hypothetical protein